MDLPVFQDNLRSSSGWLTELERERSRWNAALYSKLREGIPDSERSAYDLVPEWIVRASVGLVLADLVTVNSAFSHQETNLRTSDASPFVEGHDPVPAVILSRVLDNALEWFRTDSFNELHPVEQAALVLLRLFDLQPFPSHNLETAIIAASFYTMRANLPPIVIDDRPRFDSALQAAFRMLTQPLVEAIAENLTRTIRMVTQ